MTHARATEAGMTKVVAFLLTPFGALVIVVSLGLIWWFS